MHSKTLGSIGELAVAKDLIAQGFSVFTEMGDNARIDLIAIDQDFRCIKIQVKTCYLNEELGNAILHTSKSGPGGYIFKYSKEMIDVFALYVIDMDIILYINAEEALRCGTSFTVRFTAPKNNQLSCINAYTDYLDFKKALRGHTGDTETSKDVGEEMVQTTTYDFIWSSEN